MACRGCWECLLKLLNFILSLTGLAIVGYGIYLFVEFSKASDDNSPDISPVSDDSALIQLGRPMLMAVSLSDSFLDNLPRAWFIFLFIGVGVVLFLISCFGCIGAATRNGCCLSCYSILVALLILIELGCAAFIFFDKNWKEEIPKDKTGDFDEIYGFLSDNWNIVRWVALGIGIFQVLLFLLALIVRAANRPADYDSDEEFINPRQQVRQPLLNRPTAGPTTGVPVTGTIDPRSSRSDAWSARMREKYGLDTSEFTYNPSESSRFQQVNPQPTEEKSRCTIM
ncbi:tobamovirus multiplication protein 2A-like [Vigna unguiculata]|uniref:Transcription initiation factor TFIIH subunit 4 n=1 Tax=Vigna unguiculata TaxID=3917 RepID=A0A4D6LSJ7_VIGUN|nr:tobamovirus multiplication protein 2A-like [Vigna unguiculata]XP_027913953.1 tobamovirus multiplication protein 2A-like [Vigna unguiculata]QCD91471.1 transcription initiation factor TFIIH subunit 4 [Vigna unguiculata]